MKNRKVKNKRRLFQSLFCWKLLWKVAEYAESINPQFFVSILILLEIALEASICSFIAFIVRCFNPYSAGNCSGSNRSNCCTRELFPVSILILLEIALEDTLHLSASRYTVPFQSLFCWKLLWKGSTFMVFLKLCSCFNPYSAGNCSGRE